MKTFPSIREAAIAGLKEALPLTLRTGFEYGGLILKRGNGFTYTSPVTSNDENGVDLDQAFQSVLGTTLSGSRISEARPLLRNAGVVSNYHVHPDVLGACFSSQEDMETMMSAGFERTYMAEAGNGRVHEVTPNLPVIFPAGIPSASALAPVIAVI